jgi:membrane glycosyltransferase
MGLFNLLLYALGGWLWRKVDTGCGAPAMAEDTGDWVKSRVAIVMPIYHEDTERVYAGVMQTWESVKRQGLDRHCDFFLLCDSTEPAYREREEQMYRKLLPGFDCNRSGAGRLFLLRRADRANFKAGNIMNFLDQRGDEYGFMLVLDADSVMLGETIERLILRLQREPRTAIIQSLMLPIRSITPFARAMEYSTARCLPLYARGMQWFWGPDSVYWGHNALVRVAAFKAHCRLPTLPGKPPLGGPVLSQDIVEAAFLGRAGWEVAWDVESGGSFDELPANLLSYGRRDRRWCQGNCQHSRFLFAPGMRFGHRLYFANGIFAYLGGPLLLALICLGLIQAWRGELPQPSAPLLWGSLGLLWVQVLVPRFLGLWRAVGRDGRESRGRLARWFLAGRRARSRRGQDSGEAGRKRRLGPELASTASELALNLLLGPALFYLHARFVLEILTGGQVSWNSQSRDPRQAISWQEAWRALWLPTLLGALGVLAVQRVGFPLALFLVPVVAGWLLSVPMAVWTSSPAAGERLVRLGLFEDLLSESETSQLGTLKESGEI